MGLFSKKKKPADSDLDKKADKNDKKQFLDKAGSSKDGLKSKSGQKKIEKSGSNDKTDKALNQDGDGNLAYKVIDMPWITEKTHDLIAGGKYAFKVRLKTTKYQVKNAVERLYNVKVDKVNIVNIPQKKRRFGRITGKKSGVKKAIVTLRKGDKIEIFE